MVAQGDTPPTIHALRGPAKLSGTGLSSGGQALQPASPCPCDPEYPGVGPLAVPRVLALGR